ncbi:MAG TPA: YdaS family helix-turn-helix protein [Candidatus Aquirickettsiella sp.]|jgi:DNA-binding transcriptional regulator YdaS (Cro superfamily)
MQETIIRKAIKIFGNISDMAKKLRISRASIYNYLNGRSIPPHIASRIEKESKGKIKFKELIPWEIKYYTELDVFPCSLIKTPLNKIILPADILSFLHQKNLPLSDYRPICVDENLHLIYGLEHIEAAKRWWKKSVFSWHISLEDLRNKKYEVRYLLKSFNLIERIAIRNALEKFIGKRQGRRTDLDELVNLPPQVQGIKTRDFVADALGFGSDYVCRMLNKIFRHGSRTLILQVLEGKISISKAGEIAEYLYNKQKSIQVVKKRKQTITIITRIEKII